MRMIFETQQMAAPFYAEIIERLKKIYAAMDQVYRRTAQRYRFDCDGCRDNCCRSRFYHHTIIECACLLEGLKTLTIKRQSEVKSRAKDVIDQRLARGAGKEAVRPMCPLNFDELCILYPYRPMICRLHGLPHELKYPGQGTLFGPGCETFDRRCGRERYIRFDRTPFYQALAGLEQELRQSLGYTGKIRMTVAEMVLADVSGMGHGARGKAIPGVLFAPCSMQIG